MAAAVAAPLGLGGHYVVVRRCRRRVRCRYPRWERRDENNLHFTVLSRGLAGRHGSICCALRNRGRCHVESLYREANTEKEGRKGDRGADRSSLARHTVWTRAVFPEDSHGNAACMYPPKDDSAVDVDGMPKVMSYRSRRHETYIAANGAIEIRDAVLSEKYPETQRALRKRWELQNPHRK